MKSFTPYGVSDFIPEESARFQKHLQAINQVFDQQSYHQVKTPTLEYYDTLSSAMGEYLKEQAIKFVDRSGHLLILRPDHTTPIARLAATRMSQHDRPLKLCYNDAVFRLKSGNFCDAIERFQVGAELIGAQGVQAEIEIIMLCMRSLQAMGLKDLCLNLGHVSFSQQASEAEMAALKSKNYVELSAIPEQGGAEIFSEFPELQELYRSCESQLSECKVVANKGLVQGLYYYSGLIFEVYAKQAADPIATGGRYDHLIEKFGEAEAAVGFGIDLTLIEEMRLQP